MSKKQYTSSRESSTVNREEKLFAEPLSPIHSCNVGFRDAIGGAAE
jgi:hypothetical protein